MNAGILHLHDEDMLAGREGIGRTNTGQAGSGTIVFMTRKIFHSPIHKVTIQRSLQILLNFCAMKHYSIKLLNC